MKRYVIQTRTHEWEPWVTCPARQYDTLEEAQEAFDKMPFKVGYRIAEAYTVVRYKAVKL